MSSTTIRYSGVPENSHSRDVASDHTTDIAAYSDITMRFRAALEAERRPHDPIDPGPFGSPGWFPDRRTGRHRRGELPDPLTREEIEESPENQEWADNAEALLERRTRRRPFPGPREPESEPADGGERSEPPGGRSRPAPRPAPEPDEPYRFSRMREQAWERFLTKSEPLAAAHTGRLDRSALERECGPTIGRFVRLVKWIGSVVKHRKRTTARPERQPAPIVRPPAVPLEPSRPQAEARPRVPAQVRSARSARPPVVPRSQMARAVRGAQAGRIKAEQYRFARLNLKRGSEMPGGAAWA